MIRCPSCLSDHVSKNGLTSYGKPNHRCVACGRQFVLDPQKGPIPDWKKALVRKMLAERVALAAIARVLDVSASWLQAFVNAVYGGTPWEPQGAGGKRPRQSPAGV
jgi:transposase-like protein